MGEEKQSDMQETVEKTLVVKTVVEKTLVVKTSEMEAAGVKADGVEKTISVDTHPAAPASDDMTEAEVTEVFDSIAALDELDSHFLKIKDFASGGQGILSQGVEQNLQRRIAVKTLRPELVSDPKQCSDFLQEARTTARLEHPAIVPIHSIHHRAGKKPAIIMKLIDGEDFRTYLEHVKAAYKAKKGKVNVIEEESALHERLEIFLKVCDALQYAHSQNVMHCDLKPENVMIGKFHDTYLMDWGLAHPIRSAEYDPATWVPRKKVSGTLRYIAPETARGKYSDQRADIYSMGLILFEVVALHAAVPGNSQEEILQAVAKHRLNPLKHEFNCPISKDMQAIIVKATEVKPENRYQNIADFADDIRRYMQRDEVTANPDNFVRKIYRRCIVHHGKALLNVTLASLLAVICIAAFALYYQWKREHWAKLRGNTIEYALMEATKLASTCDAELAKVEGNLMSCIKEFAYLLDGRVNIGNKDKLTPAINALEYGKNPQKISSFQFYPEHHAQLDFEHVGYLVFKDTPKPKAKAWISYASAMQRSMQDVLLNSQFQKRLSLYAREQLTQNLKNNETSVNLVYFAFEDGFYMCYPGKKYAEDYEPRQRKWYQERIKPEAPATGWGTPYLNYSENGLVMTYSIRLDNGKDKPFGVAALDFHIAKLTSFIYEYAQERKNTGAMEVFVTNADGDVIASSDNKLLEAVTEHYRKSKTGGTEGYKYPCAQLRAVMKREKDGAGYLELEENGRTVIYVFARCRSLNWYFIGKLDREKCVEYLHQLDDEV